MILAVTGGRDAEPTPEELARLLGACHRNRVAVLRLGFPTSSPAFAWVQALAFGYSSLLRPFTWERWQADEVNHGRAAVDRRDRAMVEGDRIVCPVQVEGDGAISRGPTEVLIYWPRAEDCEGLARSLGVRTIPIGKIPEVGHGA